MRSEIGVGIIGCGSVARWKYVKNLAEMSGVSLRAFYGGRAEEFQQQYGAPGSAVCRDLAEFLAREDVDAVCICTPNNSHAEIALAALRARKHVLCEKPMAISAEDAVRMVETAEQMGVLLTVGHQSRFSPAAQALYRQLREGAFGSLYFARASMVRRMGIPTWGHFFDPAVQGGGCLIDLGTHALDLALWLLNDFSPAYCCAGIFRGPGDSPTPANRWGTWDPAMLRTETGAFGQVVLQSGTVLSLDISWALHRKTGKRPLRSAAQPPGRSSFPAAIQSAAHRAPAWSLPAIRCRRRSRAQIGRNWRIFYLPSGSIGCLW